MKFKKYLSIALSSVILLMSLTACGGSNNGNSKANTETDTKTASSEAEVILQVGFENNMSEPFSQGVQKWADLLEEKSNGTMRIDLYPDSQLGGKPALIDSMLLGENVCTLADGAFYADYGVPDFGIVFGPFLFDTWDECWTLIESDWYKEQSKLLEDKGLKLISSNWKYGERHTLTVDPVNNVEDLKGMKIRVPSNQIQSIGIDTMGATSVGMDLGDVYQALQTKTIDGAENPLATLYGRKLHEVAKYLILDGHVKNFTTLVCSADWFNSLTEEQQELLVSTANEAGLYNNEIQEVADKDYLDKMVEEGVTVVEPSPEVVAEFKEKVQPFYEMEDTFGWTPGLYDTVKASKTK
ncbi:C4-dicarboxylate TRAP transporter substrate-binding protein [Anaerosphaera multitolerans]|uniref:C4-dicarboxylate ABC transporter substrate-binding protein n=1 Tax=Anaerosphaera multitolerans TaxID=2487351 RepID=A0A437S852_9FIRM|nr:C4-dicarboxylate TRAP transporter substrate-binding protein [Anaerosphaera multitolerans]RVU55098.1 C4-dicarboxylate ABC transporter substrate-binding protein [Anaerosphaera multitolerans]